MSSQSRHAPSGRTAEHVVHRSDPRPLRDWLEPPARRGGQRNSKAARRVPRDLWRVVRRKLTMVDSARRLDDLAAVPGNRLEVLAGDRKGQHGIRVNQQYRITFRWEKHDAHDVCCEDYH